MNSSCDHLALAVRNSSVVFLAAERLGRTAVRDCVVFCFFPDCQRERERETRLLLNQPPPHTHCTTPTPAFISPPPTSAECFNLSEDPGISAAVVAEVGFFTLAGPVWEKGPAWYLKTEGLFAVRQIETRAD